MTTSKKMTLKQIKELCLLNNIKGVSTKSKKEIEENLTDNNIPITQEGQQEPGTELPAEQEPEPELSAEQEPEPEPKQLKTQPTEAIEINKNKDKILYEYYDIKKLSYLYTNLDKFNIKLYPKCETDEDKKKEESKLINFLEHILINNGKVEVHYKLTEGRRNGTNSIQGISGLVRNFLLENQGLVDIYIENAICRIIIPLFEKHNIKKRR